MTAVIVIVAVVVLLGAVGAGVPAARRRANGPQLEPPRRPSVASATDVLDRPETAVEPEFTADELAEIEAALVEVEELAIEAGEEAAAVEPEELGPRPRF